jgi:hypothetical protein
MFLRESSAFYGSNKLELKLESKYKDFLIL